MTDEPRVSNKDRITVRHYNDRHGIQTAPFPQPPLDMTKLKYGNTAFYHRMVQLAKQREREGK